MSATALKLRCPLTAVHSMKLTASVGGVTAGLMAKVEDTIVVYVETADAGVEVSAIYWAEKIELPKESTTVTFTQGDKVYFDETNAEVTSTASGNTLIGIATEDAAATATTVEVDFNGKPLS